MTQRRQHGRSRVTRARSLEATVLVAAQRGPVDAGRDAAAYAKTARVRAPRRGYAVDAPACRVGARAGASSAVSGRPPAGRLDVLRVRSRVRQPSRPGTHARVTGIAVRGCSPGPRQIHGFDGAYLSLTPNQDLVAVQSTRQTAAIERSSATRRIALQGRVFEQCAESSTSPPRTCAFCSTGRAQVQTPSPIAAAPPQPSQTAVIRQRDPHPRPAMEKYGDPLAGNGAVADDSPAAITSNIPRALRVATLRDRIVLHDTTTSLRGSDPTGRNALVDAANAADASRRAASTNGDHLVDASSGITRPGPSASPPSPGSFAAYARQTLPSPSSRTASSASAGGASGGGGRTPKQDRYLVLPFPTRTPSGTKCRPPFETSDAADAGIDRPDLHTAPVDAAAGFLGVLRLQSAAYCVIVSHIRNAGSLPSGPVLHVQKVRMLKLGVGHPSKEDREFATAITKLLESGYLYYSLDTDLTRSLEQVSSGPLTKSSTASDTNSHTELRKGNAFWWTWPMARLSGSVAASWALRTVYGFVGTHSMRFSTSLVDSGHGDFNMTLISRRSRRRAGTRYITRGADALGDVANFVETEQVVWTTAEPDVFSSYVLIRGSVPVFWRQNNGIARPSPELDGTLADSRSAFSSHFRNVLRSYGGLTAVSLVDLHGSEQVLADAFERHFELDVIPVFDKGIRPRLLSFDFHTHCGGKEYERGLSKLLEQVRDDIREFGYYAHGARHDMVRKSQRGVFRVNCVDCLDRTNVVQSLISRVVLDHQVNAVYHGQLAKPGKTGGESEVDIRFFNESEDRFKHVWGDNADAVSKQYSGTGALKTDFTRTGKRSTTGIVGDGVKSVVRMYYKNFVDEGRQEAIDILCGNAKVRFRGAVDSTDEDGRLRTLANPDVAMFGTQTTREVERNGASRNDSLDRALSDGSVVDEIDPKHKAVHDVYGAKAHDFDDSELWYSFGALRMNGGGDKQSVAIELRDGTMQISTSEGVCFEYPRAALLCWDKREETKTADRRSPSRLRLIHVPSAGAPASASPLDLLFRTGPMGRENFLRAYLSWSKPRVLDTIGGAVRIRVRSARGVSKHSMADWGLAPGHDTDPIPEECHGREIVALVLPEGHSDTREWGLAAVPLDVDASGYVLVAATAVSSRGPAIAVLASKAAAPSVMSINEASVGRSGSLTGGGAVAVSLLVSGVSVCFVSARLGGPKDLFRVLSTLRLRRAAFDVTNDFEHVYVAGVMGDLRWRRGDTPEDGPQARRFMTLGDGSQAYALGCGLSVLRNSFPTLDVKNCLTDDSFWRHRKTGADAGSGSSVGADGPTLCVGLIDEAIAGGQPPRLPEKLSKSVVTLSQLRGEGVKMPPGIDQSMPLNTFCAVYSDYVGADPVSTRPTPRPTDCPEWREPLRLDMIPSGEDEIRGSFLLGQVLIPSPLAEPIVAGQCVIPVAYCLDGRAEFDVPLRLAGIATGRLRGVIEFESVAAENGAALARDGVDGAGARADGRAVGGDLFGPAVGALPQMPAQLQPALRSAGSSLQAAGSFVESAVSGFAPQSFQPRASADDAGERFDTARRKGGRQIKSMVGKLSSLLTQTAGTGAGAGAGSGFGGGGGGGGRADGISGLPGTVPGAVDSGFGAAGQAGATTDPSSGMLVDLGDVAAALPAAPHAGVGLHANAPDAPGGAGGRRVPSGGDALLHGLTLSSGERPSLAAGTAPRDDEPADAPAKAPPAGADTLLAALSRGRSRSPPTRRPPPPVMGDDDLLAGLRTAGGRGGGKEHDGEEDEWGAFEEAPAGGRS